MSNTIRAELEGHFTLIARSERGERILAQFKNLILDSGLNRMGSGASGTHCKVGSGTTAPATSQTALVTQVAQTTNIYAETAGGDAVGNLYAFIRRTYRFAEGVAAGNLSEVGVGWDTGLFSRALIKDTNGDPTTITVLADETLDVIYELRMYCQTVDTTATVTIDGVSRTFTIRAAEVNNTTGPGSMSYALNLLVNEGAVYTGYPRVGVNAYATDAALAARSGSMSGTILVPQSSITYAFSTAYANNSYQRAVRATWAATSGTGAAPFGGFQIYTPAGIWQATVAPAIAKDATKVFTLDFTFSWARKT